MTNPSIKCTIMLALIALHLLACSTDGQAADDPRASQLTFEPWNKVCLGNSDCFVGTGATGTCVPSGGAVVIHTVNGKVVSLGVNFGTRRVLEGDISVQVDQGQPTLIPHRECYPVSCGGEFNVDGDFVERLKRSKTITIEATTTTHRRITLSFPLAGLVPAYDGPGTEPKVIEEIMTSDEMKERLKRAEREKPPECDD
jgi:invasion protein IalB